MVKIIHTLALESGAGDAHCAFNATNKNENYFSDAHSDVSICALFIHAVPRVDRSVKVLQIQFFCGK